VTPSAWGVSQKAIQIKTFASFYDDEYNGTAVIGYNMYQSANSTFNYNFTGIAASRYVQGAGQHQWFISTGTPVKDAAISFTQAMTLDASGNLGIGTTSPANKLEIHSNTTADCSLYFSNDYSGAAYAANIKLNAANTSGANYNGLFCLSNGTVNWQIYGAGSSNTIAFATGSSSTERMRIDSSGNLLVGTTSNPSNYKFLVNGYMRDNSVAGAGEGIYLYRGDGNPFDVFVRNMSSTGFIYTATYYSWKNVTNTSEFGRFDASGNLLVAKTTADLTAAGLAYIPANGGAGTGALSLSGAASTNSANGYHMYSTGAAAYRFYVGYGGTIFATSTTISGISDVRYKENIRDLDVGLDAVLALKPRKFDWKEGKGADVKNARGFIAQEFEQVFPDLIDEWKDKPPEGEEPYKSVRPDLMPIVIKAIQELSAKVQALEAKVA